MTNGADSRTTKATIGREASGWLVSLADSPDDLVLRQDFEAWIARSPAHAAIWDETVRAYDLFGAVPPRPAPLPPLRDVRPRGWGRLRAAPARRIAVMAVAALAAVVIAPSMLLHIRAEAVTGAGETQMLTLADGSSVRLAPQSAIAVDMDSSARRVRLLKGEAWFDVQHDPSRPFTVAANGTQTRVLGTAFDVRIEDNGSMVAVERGRVQVSPDEDGATADVLLPGDWVAMTPAGARDGGRMPSEDVGAASRGEIVAEKRSVRDVVDALRPWHAGYILLTGDRIAGLSVTGLYNARRPEAVLEALATTQGGVVRRVTPWLLILSDN